MKEDKQSTENKVAPGESKEALTEAGQRKRELIKKFGNYAVVAPIGMYVLMSPKRSAAAVSGPDALPGGLL